MNWLNWFHFLIFVAGAPKISNMMLEFSFSFNIQRCYKGVSVNSFLINSWNSLPAERFSLTYDLYGIKFRVNRQLLPLGSF